MDGNPNTKQYCEGCTFWDPVGFYTWEREENPLKRECKHLKRCNRVFLIANKQDKQISLSDFIGGKNEIHKEKSKTDSNHE